MREVWIFNHYAVPPNAGAGTRHYDLATRLATKGIKTTVFASSFNHFTGIDHLRGFRLVRTRRYDAVTFVWLRTIRYRGNNLLRIANMLSYLFVAVVGQLPLRRPEVVIGSSVHPFAALAAYLVARMRRARFIFEIRDLWPQTLVDMGAMSPNSVQARVLWGLESFLVRRAESVVSVLPGIRDYLRERNLPTERVVYLPNAVRLTDTRPTPIPDAMREQLERWKSEGAFIATYAGSHGAANALDTLLDAADRLQRGASSVRIAMVGGGPDKQRLEAEARTRSLQNVTFFDPIPKTAVNGLLSRSDAAIFHLADVDVFRYGISSNKLFDYLAAGRPVVFACRSGNDPVQEAGAGISIPPSDPEALASALAELAGMQVGERSEMGKRGRQYVERHHTIDAIGDRLAELVA